jgi:cation:H+ antiporter
MEFLYLLGGLIGLLLGTDTAMKGVSGALQQGGLKPLSAGLVLVVVGYALPGLALIAGAAAWQSVMVAASAAHGAMLGTLGFGAAGLLISTGLVLRVRPWKMLDGDKAQAELAEFAASREGWGRNGFRVVVGAVLLVAGARGVLAGAPFVATLLDLVPGVDASSSTAAIVLSAALGVGGTVAVVSTFNARFGDAAAAFAALLGGGGVLLLAASLLAFIVALPTPSLSLLAHPLLHGALLLTLLAVIAKPAKSLGRGTGGLILAVTAALLATVVLLAGWR